MRYIALFLGFIISTSTFAAKPSKVAGASDFSRKLAGATSWDSLFKVVDGSLNPLVMKELRGLTDGLPYPQMRMKNDRLMISNENGEHLTMVLFEKNGDVSFNGKRWEIQPLAKTETEVKRIAEILGSAHASLWDYVVSPAYAGGLSMTMGVAAAAYTSAASWKAEACAKPNPSDELVKTCSLMAVSMNDSEPKSDSNGFTPIKLGCFEGKSGTLTLVSKSKLGSANRSQVTFSEGKPTKVTYFISMDGASFVQAFTYDFATGSDEKFKSPAEKVAIKAAELKASVCSASKEDKAAYFAKLEASSKALQVSQNETPVSDERKVKSGL